MKAKPNKEHSRANPNRKCTDSAVHHTHTNARANTLTHTHGPCGSSKLYLAYFISNRLGFQSIRLSICIAWDRVSRFPLARLFQWPIFLFYMLWIICTWYVCAFALWMYTMHTYIHTHTVLVWSIYFVSTKALLFFFFSSLFFSISLRLTLPFAVLRLNFSFFFWSSLFISMW